MSIRRLVYLDMRNQLAGRLNLCMRSLALNCDGVEAIAITCAIRTVAPIADPNAQRRRLFLDLVKRRVRPGAGSSLHFLNQRTWNHAVTNLNAIIRQVPFVVVGGVATRLYMPERMTLDLDILIEAKNAPLAYQDLVQAGHQKVGKLNIAGSQWQLTDGTSLDVLEASEPWVAEAIAHPNYSPDGLPVIDLPYLVLMKLISGRSQDLADISRMLGGATDLQLKRVRRLICQYLVTAKEDLESLIALGKLERH